MARPITLFTGQWADLLAGLVATRLDGAEDALEGVLVGAEARASRPA